MTPPQPAGQSPFWQPDQRSEAAQHRDKQSRPLPFEESLSLSMGQTVLFDMPASPPAPILDHYSRQQEQHHQQQQHYQAYPIMEPPVSAAYPVMPPPMPPPPQQQREQPDAMLFSCYDDSMFAMDELPPPIVMPAAVASPASSASSNVSHPDYGALHVPGLGSVRNQPRPLPPALVHRDVDLRLLIVEDDEFVRTTFRIMLETIADLGDEAASGPPLSPGPHSPGGGDHRIKIHIEFADSGERGLELLQSKGFDLAIVDVHLGDGVSGLDLSWCYQKILFNADASSDVSGEQTVVIACTADRSTSFDQIASYGVHDLIHKPVSLPALRHALHKWMPRRDADLDPLAPLGGSGANSSSSSSRPAASISNSNNLSIAKTASGRISLRVLLVEDCEVTRTASDLVFRQLGLCIDTASTGEAAVARLERHQYDLCLFDVNLPTMSGYALCSWYKEHQRKRQMPVAFVVAVTADPDPESCKQFGIDVCLPKPLSVQHVAEMLRQYWLTQHQSRRAAPPTP